ncbi:uncharacterized protein LY89DRAFT_728792 [Mollisia scopiformis]|uniref:Uncharacterized protein n=1 Tax=Mollisia scopiformis TaxID=149040 RepID=A0A194XR57_MOLSC|nr:uncharacterized protein LY89DRAFT_728792 [Mollisia scopiformis]KUJ22673.1 hypothetical protein LY89DRAFT_728792 [Mollisia scopiformis]
MKPTSLLSLLACIHLSTSLSIPHSSSLEKRQNNPTCAHKSPAQPFPCSWKATPNDPWTSYHDSATLLAAQTSSIASLNPPHRSPALSTTAPENEQRSQAVLSNKEAQLWCGLPGLWTYPCPWTENLPPRLVTPYVFCKWIVSTPGVVIGEPIAWLKKRFLSQTEVSRSRKRNDCGWKGKPMCPTTNVTAASAGVRSVSIPRFFGLGSLAVHLLLAGRGPGVAAVAIPSVDKYRRGGGGLEIATPTNISSPSTIDEKAALQSCEYDGYTGQQSCPLIPTSAAGRSLEVPRIFSFSALLIHAMAGTIVSAIPITGPMAFTESLAAPSFELVRESVGWLVGLLPGFGSDCGEKEVGFEVVKLAEEIGVDYEEYRRERVEEYELRKREVREVKIRDGCENDEADDGYCMRAEAGRREVRWAFMGVLGLAGVFAVLL